jgi:hypothetical protein
LNWKAGRRSARPLRATWSRSAKKPRQRRPSDKGRTAGRCLPGRRKRPPVRSRCARSSAQGWAGLRDPAAMARLPSGEREACKHLRAEVEALLNTPDPAR